MLTQIYANDYHARIGYSASRQYTTLYGSLVNRSRVVPATTG